MNSTRLEVLTEQAHRLYEHCLPDLRVLRETLSRLRASYQRPKHVLAAAHATVPASLVLVSCPDCGGEGYVEIALPAGYLDRAQQRWYPLERSEVCGRCRSGGETAVPAGRAWAEAA